MAPQPKRRHARGRGRVRSQILKLTSVTLISCANCKKSILPHKVCPFCGFYDGHATIIKTKKKPSANENKK